VTTAQLAANDPAGGAPALLVEYEGLWRRAEEAKEAGRLEEALGWYGESLAAARRTGDAELIDRATCNEAAVAIALGDIDPRIPPMREILMRNGSITNCYLAAYNIARAYELRKEPKKGLFYARIARERAEQIGQPQRRAVAHNQMGNALVAESMFEEAAKSYRLALALVPEEQGDLRLLYITNLAYCEVVLGRHRVGVSRLYGALRLAVRRASPRIEMMARLDLCFGLMEMGRLDAADRHARRAYPLTQKIGEVGHIKNCLYLLGQIAVLGERPADARHWFELLQRRFYPERPQLVDLLIGIDIRRMVNLRA
jgi:tetratricopeptide (TPR) repeat protein